MPFKSEKQRRYLWAKEPAIARKWTKEHGSKPVKKKSGGLFHADGYDTAPWVNVYGYPTGGITVKKGGR